MVPTCNFYRFLVSFASQASPEDTHGARGLRETKGETMRSEETESEAEGLKRERQRQGGNAATLNPI